MIYKGKKIPVLDMMIKKDKRSMVRELAARAVSKARLFNLMFVEKPMKMIAKAKAERREAAIKESAALVEKMLVKGSVNTSLDLYIYSDNQPTREERKAMFQQKKAIREKAAQMEKQERIKEARAAILAPLRK